MLLTSSYDNSVKMYQFPIFWPAEMIRKNKNAKTLLEEKETAAPGKNTDEVEDLSNEFGSQIKLPREITDLEIFSYDLDGWDE
jgi:hypothetical protein